MVTSSVCVLRPNQSLRPNSWLHAGPIIKLWLPDEQIFVSNYALAKDGFDEKKFQKSVTGPLEEIRQLAGDGLITEGYHQCRPHEQATVHRGLLARDSPAPFPRADY